MANAQNPDPPSTINNSRDIAPPTFPLPGPSRPVTIPRAMPATHTKAAIPMPHSPSRHASEWYTQASQVAEEIFQIYTDIALPLRVRGYSASFVGLPRLDAPCRPSEPGSNDNAKGLV